MERIEFFFDLSSPWTYLAFTNLQAVLARTNASVRYRPILAGGVFNAVNPTVYAGRENPDSPRQRHMMTVLHEWATWTGLSLKFPSAYHPARSVHAMRMATSLETDQPALYRFAKGAFESYFLRAENLDDPDVLVMVADAVGIDGAQLRMASQSDPIKARLRASTEELVSRGGFGSPTVFLDGSKMFFGNDQLPLVEFALTGSRGIAGPIGG